MLPGNSTESTAVSGGLGLSFFFFFNFLFVLMHTRQLYAAMRKENIGCNIFCLSSLCFVAANANRPVLSEILQPLSIL